jgi:hypothetical protein
MNNSIDCNCVIEDHYRGFRKSGELARVLLALIVSGPLLIHVLW